MATSNDPPIVGPEVADQARIRPPKEIADLGEYLSFLSDLESLFGPIVSTREITRGGRFLL